MTAKNNSWPRKTMLKQSKELFSCEHLVASEDNFNQIMAFVPKYESGSGVVDHLKRSAFAFEDEEIQRTYLIKDSSTGELAAYFSIKAGSFYAGESKLATSPTGYNILPGIEVANLAVNKIYTDKHPEAAHKLGAFVFRNYVMDKVITAADIIGARVVFIYALPKDDLRAYYSAELGFSRLPKEIEDALHKTMKPDYDENCTFMYIDIKAYRTRIASEEA